MYRPALYSSLARFKVATRTPSLSAATLYHKGSRSGKRLFSTSKDSTTTFSSGPAKASPSGSTSGPMEFTSSAQKHAYLKAANAEMERYHNARELFKQGKLGQKKSSESSKLSTGTMQIGVVTLFLIAFMATPWLGKRMAQDDDFRKKYIPTWYDYTVPKPENPWTREELHEQMIAVQREIRERAIRGDFKPDKLDELQKSFEKDAVPARIPKEWERIHPGLEDGETVHED